MAKNRERSNPLGTVRRSIWFVLRAVIIVSLLLAAAFAVFTEAMYISNMYIIVTEGMELRADTILKNGSSSDLEQHFTLNFLIYDSLLNEKPYSDFIVDNFDYRYEIKGVSVFPWSKSGYITYEERIPTITGAPVSEEITAPMPAWTSTLSRVHLIKVDGRWLIDSIDVIEVEPEAEPAATPDMSKMETQSN
ncbi:MAG: hypothetical protein K6F68_06980 [Clostridiales bacterium]|nr:hypothetical protein [Clostridiales bacterium]